MENTAYTFNVVDRFDLDALYSQWAAIAPLGAYWEPEEGWKLLYAYAFTQDTAALVFENGPVEGRLLYRILIFSQKDGKYRIVRKIRRREEPGCRIQAISVDSELETLFILRLNETGKNEIVSTEIGDKENPYESISEVLAHALPISSLGLIALEENHVLFIARPDEYTIENDEDDTHDFLRQAYMLTGGKDDKEDEENGDDSVCQIEPVHVSSDPACTAEEKLSRMIGLSEVKQRIREFVAFAKLQKLAKERGKPLLNISMNLLFTGNPGTAKTTVARLFAGIMKEKGLLSKGDLVEVGRADLIAKYVGQTAPKVREVFKKAQGNVLFIDEAYSLVDGWENEYGDEALAAIVQEMENRREDLVVIFAGYPDKMESFLSRNPGLRSRIPFVVDFPDYSGEEMVRIALLEAESRGFSMTAKAQKKLLRICEKAAYLPESGNGRFSRNLVESAILKAALRLADQEEPGDIFVLKESDFTEPENKKDGHRCSVIGFHVA